MNDDDDGFQPDLNFTGGLPYTRDGFLVYHAENPHIYDKLRQYALEAKRSGRTHFSVQMLFERVRWYTTIEASSGDSFKLNNNWRPFYARLLMEDPELTGLFELRRSKADVH